MSKDELREKLSQLYKTTKDQVSVFGFRTQFGGGKSTGFALLYDSAEAMKKFEPHYRLVRYGQATKIEKASRQQRESKRDGGWQRGNEMRIVMMEETMMATPPDNALPQFNADGAILNRQAEEEPLQGVPWNCQDQGRQQGQEEINGSRGCWCNGFGYALLASCIWCSVLYLHDLVWEKHRLGVDDAEISRAMRFCHQLLVTVTVVMYNFAQAHGTRQRLDDKSKNDNPDALHGCLRFSHDCFKILVVVPGDCLPRAELDYAHRGYRIRAQSLQGSLGDRR